MRENNVSTKCVVYGRVSTEDQDIESQSIKLNDWAKANDTKIVKTFEEKLSGSTKMKDRKAFTEMVSFIEEQDIKLILTYSISRLAR